MAFLTSIESLTERRLAGLSKQQNDEDPATHQDKPWIYESDPKYAALPSGGKWILRAPSGAPLTKLWRKCQTLYRQGELQGVESMKVSTGRYMFLFSSIHFSPFFFFFFLL